MKNTVTKEQVESCIIAKDVKTVDLVGKKHTLVAVRLKNDFTIVETTTCVDPDNYSEEIGAEICMKRITDKIWMLEGYLLQEELYSEAQAEAFVDALYESCEDAMETANECN